MSFRVHINGRAWADVASIYAWLEARSPIGAARWYASFLEASFGLRHTPLSHGVAMEDQWLGRSIRQRLFRTRRGRFYRLLFAVQDDEV